MLPSFLPWLRHFSVILPPTIQQPMNVFHTYFMGLADTDPDITTEEKALRRSFWRKGLDFQYIDTFPRRCQCCRSFSGLSDLGEHPLSFATGMSLLSHLHRQVFLYHCVLNSALHRMVPSLLGNLEVWLQAPPMLWLDSGLSCLPVDKLLQGSRHLPILLSSFLSVLHSLLMVKTFKCSRDKVFAHENVMIAKAHHSHELPLWLDCIHHQAVFTVNSWAGIGNCYFRWMLVSDSH